MRYAGNKSIMLNILGTITIFLNGILGIMGQDFSYDGELGPEHWSEKYQSCKGKYQSPINIDLLNVINTTFQPLQFIGFDRKPALATITNTGHTVQINMDFQNLPSITSGPLNDSYYFAQIHFHWGENDTYGSEDLINNHSFPVELHMVLYRSQYEDFKNAVNFPNGVAVLAYFYEARKGVGTSRYVRRGMLMTGCNSAVSGACADHRRKLNLVLVHQTVGNQVSRSVCLNSDNFFHLLSNETNMVYEDFLSHLNEIITPGSNKKIFNPPMLNKLIVTNSDEYITYRGSLTTPPCSETVIWIDFINAIPISSEQITKFRNLHSLEGHNLTHNFRPIQPLNGRDIYLNNRVDYTPEDDDFNSRHSTISPANSFLKHEDNKQPGTKNRSNTLVVRSNLIICFIIIVLLK